MIRAKSVILATGSASRLYPPAPSPGWLFNTAFCPTCTGAAQATAYRAGAKLVNMEFPNRHAGPKFLARCGKATWIGIVADPQGRPVGPFVQQTHKRTGRYHRGCVEHGVHGHERVGQGAGLHELQRHVKRGRRVHDVGSEERRQHSHARLHEEGRDRRPQTHGGVHAVRTPPDRKGCGDRPRTGKPVWPALFAAGDPVGNFRADIAGAATYGWIAGGSAAERAMGPASSRRRKRAPSVQERAKLYFRIPGKETRARTGGKPTWPFSRS